jgi:polyhydroxybutyrate depolymerase
MVHVPRHIAALAALTIALGGCSPTCEGGEDKKCRVPMGTFYALPPADWNGRSALPLAFHIHGWNNDADSMLRRRGILQKEMSKAGYMLILPDGKQQSWNLTGVPGSRDELKFFDQMIDALERDFPIDSDRIYAGGHSLGGSMTWELACHRSERFAAFAPTAGGFWEPMPTSCPAKSVAIFHTHGLADTTVPMEGRRLGNMEQGDIHEGWTRWMSCNGCSDATTTVVDGNVSCEQYTDCDKGALKMCTHDGAHKDPVGWEKRTVAWYDSHPG